LTGQNSFVAVKLVNKFKGDGVIDRVYWKRIIAARKALQEQQEVGNYFCGCWSATGRDPFDANVVSHWQMYHPASLALLEYYQTRRRKR
jgi:hypothetical protein